jgi:Asp-tRNA(Asn)/Glu-tRNA(Gln) amidotransferase B subunit
MCQNAQAKASQMWDYEKDSSLKDAVIDLLTMEVNYLQKFSETSRYRNIDNLTEEDKIAYNWIVTELNEVQNYLNKQFTNLQDTQEAFAAKHGLNLE